MDVRTQVREADQAQRGAPCDGQPPVHHPNPRKQMEKIEMSQDPMRAELRALEESYAERVNMAVAEDRYDLVDEFAAEFEAERGRLFQAA